MAMCGRFTNRVKPEALAAEFGLKAVPLLEPRYNVAPTQEVAAVRLDRETGTRRLDLLRWGLVPSWADDPAIGNRMINARAETVAEKPAYRHAYRTLLLLNTLSNVHSPGQFVLIAAHRQSVYHFINLIGITHA
jgi:putative SOS response-associated peptidase YedK